MQLAVRQTIFTVALAFLFLGSRAFGDAIHDAVASGNLDRVQTSLKTNTDFVSSKDANGDTPLHFAAKKDRKDIAKFLLSHGANAGMPGTTIQPMTPVLKNLPAVLHCT